MIRNFLRYFSLSRMGGLSVNRFIIVMTSVVFCSLISVAAAADSVVPREDGRVSLEDQKSAYPGVPTAIMERRKFNGSGGDNFSENSKYFGGGDWPEGGFLGNLGIIAYHPFNGANTLHQCIAKTSRPWDYFTSLDANCEGHSKPVRRRIIGYVYSYQRPGTSALYRCRQDLPGRTDRFDSTRADCDGWGSTVNEGVLGYMMAY